MYIVFFPRTGLPHIFNYETANGKCKMLCGKDIEKNTGANSMAIDTISPGICSNCSKEAEARYENDLDNDPRIARNSWQYRLRSLRDYHNDEILGPINHIYIMETRSYPKVHRAKKKCRKK